MFSFYKVVKSERLSVDKRMCVYAHTRKTRSSVAINIYVYTWDCLQDIFKLCVIHRKRILIRCFTPDRYCPGELRMNALRYIPEKSIRVSTYKQWSVVCVLHTSRCHPSPQDNPGQQKSRVHPAPSPPKPYTESDRDYM